MEAEKHLWNLRTVLIFIWSLEHLDRKGRYRFFLFGQLSSPEHGCGPLIVHELLAEWLRPGKRVGS